MRVELYDVDFTKRISAVIRGGQEKPQDRLTREAYGASPSTYLIMKRLPKQRCLINNYSKVGFEQITITF